MARFLSKTRLMSARQCLKRLHLEINSPQLGHIGADTEAAFRTGNAVGELARQIYDPGDAILIPYEGGLKHALQKTRRVLKEVPPRAVFEATLQYSGVLVRVDVLLPDQDNWRLIEVKAATSVRDEHLFDCAIQSWVCEGLGINLSSVSLAHVDTSFVYEGNGDYRGLLSEADVTTEVDGLRQLVPDWIRQARAAAGPDEPDTAVGNHCNKPYPCPFIEHCWPSDSEFPVQQLPRATRSKLAGLIAEGITDLREVPSERLTDKQLRVQRVVRENRAELLPGAREFVGDLEFPRYYLDFETVAPAIPVWPGTRPYETLAVQWSCHFEPEPGRFEHSEFLDLSGEPPMRRLAESLIRVLGDHGPVLMYSRYEERVINSLMQRFPDLEPALQSISARLVDLQPVTEQNFYAPSMAGSWSLKAVLPAISTDISYEKLDGIQEGMAASEGYLEAIDPATSESRKEQLKGELLEYCRIDTEAMVRLVEFLGGDSG